MQNIATKIGKRIRNYRLSQKINQETLAERAGLHPTYIGQLERGEKNATLESISKVANALDIPLSTLFTNIEQHEEIPQTYPEEAYEIISSLTSLSEQESMLSIIKEIIHYKNS